MKKVIFSTDANLEHCTSLLLNDGTYISMDYSYDSESFFVSSLDINADFPKGEKLDSWIDIEGVNSFSGTEYTDTIPDDDGERFNFVNDIMSYYSMQEFTGQLEQLNSTGEVSEMFNFEIF